MGRHRAPLGLLLLALVLAGCSSEEEAAAVEQPPPEAIEAPCVVVEPVAAATVRDEVVVRANLLADRSSIVMSRSAGYVAELDVTEGDHVVGGETVLMTIRAEELGLGVNAARAGVEMAQAGLNQTQLQLQMARTDLQRVQTLFDRGAATGEELDRMTTMVAQMEEGVSQAEAQLRLARNAVRQARERAGDAEVLAPIDGVVLHRLVEIGELVSAFPPTPLFQVIDPRVIRVVAHVPERDAARTGLDQSVTIELGDGRQLSDRIVYVAPALDPLSRTLEVRAVLDNSDGALRHGQSAWVRIELGESQRPVVPRHALSRVAGDHGYLFTVTADDRTAQALEVRLGALQNDGYPVLEGLRAGDRIVTRGWTTLSEGSLVRVATDGTCHPSED